MSRDWAKAQELVADGERAVAALSDAPALARSAAMKALADVKAAAGHREPLATRRAANRLAAVIVDMYAPLRPTVPTSVMRLDALLREVELAGAAGDLAGARGAFGRANAIWTSISSSPPLPRTDAARVFGEMLAGAERAIASGRPQPVERSARAALEGVDGIEKVLEDAPR